MPTSLAHLHALAERALDAHERRAGELRGRLAPVLAAGAAAVALLTPQALAALRSGSPLSAAAFLLTITTAVATVVTIGRFLNADLRTIPLDPRRVIWQLQSIGALDTDEHFHTAMVAIMSKACSAAAAELATLRRRFTAIMCGILVVLCGLALTAVVR